MVMIGGVASCDDLSLLLLAAATAAPVDFIGICRWHFILINIRVYSDLQVLLMMMYIHCWYGCRHVNLNQYYHIELGVGGRRPLAVGRRRPSAVGIKSRSEKGPSPGCRMEKECARLAFAFINTVLRQ